MQAWACYAVIANNDITAVCQNGRIGWANANSRRSRGRAAGVADKSVDCAVDGDDRLRFCARVFNCAGAAISGVVVGIGNRCTNR